MLTSNLFLSPKISAQSTSSSIVDLEAQSQSGASPAPHKNSQGVILSFGPTVGSGRGSENVDIRYGSGFDLSLTKLYSLKTKVGIPLAFGPQLSLSNVILDTKFSRDRERFVGRYDQRTGAIGLRLKWDNSSGVLNTPVYGALTGGLTFSKLALNRTTADTFQKIDMSRIHGRTLQFELGTGFQLTERFDLLAGWTTTLYRLDQTQARGTFEGEYLSDQQLGLIQGSLEAGSSSDFLADHPTLRLGAFKVGFAASL